MVMMRGGRKRASVTPFPTPPLPHIKFFVGLQDAVNYDGCLSREDPALNDLASWFTFKVR